MSSLLVINKAVNGSKGGGLPFYNKAEHAFSTINKGFNDSLGLWKVPNNKLPTFQLWLPQQNFVLLTYLETFGGTVFTGNIYTTGVTITPIEVLDNGLTKFIYQTLDSTVLAPPPINSKWVLELRVDDGVLETIYWSEEFITCSL